MKTLLILRHAKSSWDDPGLRDHDRPLNRRGKRDAPRMGRLIADRDLIPDRIVSSTAVRARTTAALAAAEFDHDVEIETTRDLYGAHPDGYIEVAEERGGAAERLMVVGHNPGITALVSRLTGVSRVHAHRRARHRGTRTSRTGANWAGRGRAASPPSGGRRRSQVDT